MIQSKPNPRKFFSFLGILSALVVFNACSKSTIQKGTPQISDMSTGDNSQSQNAGVLTASEWNDLANWTFWTDLLGKNNNAAMQSKWGFYTNNRISFQLTNGSHQALCDVKVDLLLDGKVIFTARTDNKGKAELWANLNASSNEVDYSKLQISVNNGEATLSNVKPFSQGINTLSIESAWQNDNTANISFVIDVTSSMTDELKYLKNELYDVIGRIKSNNPQSDVYTSVVFYKDEGDDFVTKKSDFSKDENQSINFLKAEETGGGGDYPEAVHSALDQAVNTLNWSSKAKSRIMFLILDAPPHADKAVISSLQNSILNAAAKGIKLIPVLASGADKDAEFSVRLMAMATNGNFTFLTDDSKKGNQHYQPSVGSYQIEYLNNLMVRLVNSSLQ
ncbi:MAG: vWA domain-containing protein [Bacteroidota bacterium]